MADTKKDTAAGTELAKVVAAGELMEQPDNDSMDLAPAPDFAQKGHEGMEHLTKDDILMPRIGLAQQMSPELVDGDPKFIEGLKIGNLFNSLTRFNYGNGPVRFTVIRMDPPRWVLFRDRNEGGGIINPNVHPQDPAAQWGPKGEKPLATKFYDFLLMLHPSREIVALSFKSTGIATARVLNGLVAARNRVMYAGIFKLTTTMKTNPKGRFAIYQVGNAGWITDKALYEYARQLHEGLANKLVKIDDDPDPNNDPDTFDVESLEKQNAAPVGDVGRM